jgi:hypothetical protein
MTNLTHTDHVLARAIEALVGITDPITVKVWQAVRLCLPL